MKTQIKNDVSSMPNEHMFTVAAGGAHLVAYATPNSNVDNLTATLGSHAVEAVAHMICQSMLSSYEAAVPSITSTDYCWIYWQHEEQQLNIHWQ